MYIIYSLLQDRPTLQTTMHSSKLIFNPDIAEAAALRSRYFNSFFLTSIYEYLLYTITNDMVLINNFYFYYSHLFVF